MTSSWLWDKNLSELDAQKILKDDRHPDFFRLAATLLARNNSAKEVFSVYLDSQHFYENWLAIKKVMRRDNWNLPRIDYWQAIYEKLKDKYKGIPLRQAKPEKNMLCKMVGEKVKLEREKRQMTQAQLAKKLQVSQQMLSRIEKGQENVSLSTLEKTAQSLNLKIRLELKK
ncbi:helix-turn-helix transcriptional regulator [Candidatus Saganbacteria bacterium]|nr:helix-turn-helix transcriptional regulator [Candidatus Saganbacteria bacterium]